DIVLRDGSRVWRHEAMGQVLSKRPAARMSDAECASAMRTATAVASPSVSIEGTSVAGRGGLIAVAEVAMFLLYCERKTLATPKGHKRLRVATETGLRQWQSRQRLQSGVEFGTQ
ncbi:hypothetical protein GW17_00060967, partial [Ensete ventricosum]